MAKRIHFVNLVDKCVTAESIRILIEEFFQLVRKVTEDYPYLNLVYIMEKKEQQNFSFLTAWVLCLLTKIICTYAFCNDTLIFYMSLSVS